MPPSRRRPLQWLTAWFRPAPKATTEREQALALVRAVDAGGLPLNPARVNQIARQLGLEVSSRAPVDETIARIRAALLRPELPVDPPATGTPDRQR